MGKGETTTITVPGGRVSLHPGGELVVQPWDGPAKEVCCQPMATLILKIARDRQLAAGLKNGWVPL